MSVDHVWERLKFYNLVVLVGLFYAFLSYTALHSVILEPTFKGNIFSVVMGIPLLSMIITIVLKSFFGDITITKAFRFWNATSALIALILIEFHAIYGFGEPTSHSITPYVPSYIFAVSVITVALMSEYPKAQKILIVFGVIVGIICFHLPFFNVRSVIPYALCTVAIFGSISMFFVTLKYRRVSQVFLVLIALRLIALCCFQLDTISKVEQGAIASVDYSKP